MFERAYVQLMARDRPGAEADALLKVFAERGLETHRFYAKDMRRARLQVLPETLVAGDHEVMRMAFKRLCVEPRRLPGYPEVLRPLLRRKLWATTVGEVQSEQMRLPVFVKPVDREKRFTGFVYEGSNHAIGFQGASRNLPVFCCEVVDFRSEFRAYVVHGEVRGVCQYHGATEQPHLAFARSAAARLYNSADAVAGYALDFGRLATGEWAVIECNDGYALGLYDGLAAEDYADLVCARWLEIVGLLPSFS